MADIKFFEGGVTVTGNGIELVRLISLRAALGMELRRVPGNPFPKGMLLELAREASGLDFPEGDEGRAEAVAWLDAYIPIVKGGCSVEDEQEEGANKN